MRRKLAATHGTVEVKNIVPSTIIKSGPSFNIAGNVLPEHEIQSQQVDDLTLRVCLTEQGDRLICQFLPQFIFNSFHRLFVSYILPVNSYHAETIEFSEG